MRFLRATAFPIAVYGWESWAMTSGDKRVDAFELWCYGRLLGVSWMERIRNKWVLEMIGSVLKLRKSRAYGGEEYEVIWPHHPEERYEYTGMEKILMPGKMEVKRRRGKPATTWFQDLKEWTKLDIAATSQLATDRERWRKIISKTQQRR